ncbi:T9SS type A sorting domain-containing protein [Adhaeribacter aerolatus]|uniref:T9SS type A sorting domain-containing protein n=1 Tax=Adhaeribacter aerolatus TaxID=670289 RepID=UPI001478438C|nr:T9SS type A sorting domain-containing protein [Adhaeribacter aerolatus]
MKNYIYPISLIFLFCFDLRAQSGSWLPVGADLSYPRTLLKASQVASVRNSLSNGINFSLYSGLYNSINGSIPGDNTANDGRRARATFAKNTAFVVLIDRKPAGSTLTILAPEERANFINNLKAALENINTNVEAFPSYTNWQWRSKELIDYMIAYDLLRGVGEDETSMVTSKAKLQQFAGNLYTQSVANIFGYNFYNSVKNNHALMTAAALGLSAVVLNDATSTTAAQQPVNWINNGLYNIDNVLWRDAKRQSDSTAVAGYAEGPYYFKYAFLNVLPFVRAMGNFLPDGRNRYTYNGASRSIRNPYYDHKFDLLYEWMSAILMPDGRYPALEDSYVDMGMPELALTGKSRYVQPLALKNLAPNQLNSLTAQLRDLTVDMRAAYLAANITPAEAANSTLTVLPKSGNLVFRSGNDSLANYLHLYGKNGLAQSVTGGHNHGDASSFILHAKGQLLALDAGYLSSSYRDSVGKATNHNLILVDGAGPAIGTDGTTNDAEAFIQNTFNTRQLAYGEVRTAYLGTNITRKTLQVRKNYYLLADFVNAPAAHNYTWQLHGYGLENGTAATGTFTDNLATQQEGIWQKNGVNLKAHVTATGSADAYTKGTNIHEVTYNKSEKHTTLLVQKNGVTQTQFLALLHPYTTNAATVTTTSTNNTAGLAATNAAYQDIAWAQADTSYTTYSNNNLPEVGSDARLTFYSQDNTGSFAQAFVEQGTTLQYGASQVLQSTQRANINWQQTDLTHYEGYVSRNTSLTLALPAPPTTVVGANISDYNYNITAGTLAIEFSGPSNFGVITQNNALPVRLINFKAARQEHIIQLNWQTAVENQNAGFTVRRKSEGEKEFRPIGFVAGKGNSQTLSFYRFEDKTAPSAAINYYQLIQTDWDGKTHTSPVIAVQGRNYLSPELTVFPVPAAEYLQVNLRGVAAADNLHLQLYTLNGEVVLHQKFSNETSLNVSKLKPGLYYLRVLDVNGQVITAGKKIIINH